jgi:hypothetical protein
MNTTLKAAIGGLSAIGITSITLAPAIAVTLLNGGLVPIVGTPTTQELNAGGTRPNSNSTTIPNWTVSGSYDWLYADGLNATSNTTGSKLWGDGQSVSSPTGSGWFIALDGDQSFPGSIEQTVTGLTTGGTYSVNFWQAAGQQHKQPGDTGFFGVTTERWEVSLANSGAAKLSNLMIPTNITSEGGIHADGVTPWEQQTMYFTYTGTTGSALLKFLAKGTPSDGTAPPFSLLAGVSVTEAVPEPSEVVGTILGVGACFVLRSRLKQKK